MTADEMPRWSATELAKLLDQPPPTEEQITIIEAPLEPMLAIAGAGSGKTATMASKVVYLVANRFVLPEQILGLTFTRKAAAELSDRVRARLRAIAEVDDAIDLGTSARIATYNSYAGGIVRDHGLRFGVDPDAALLGEAGRYQLSERIVTTWPDDIDTGAELSTIIDAVRSLSDELSEHGLTPRDVTEYLTRLITELESKAIAPRAKAPRAVIRDLLGRLRSRIDLMDLVDEFARAKRDGGFVDFGDQVRIAADLARSVPAVGAGERDQYRVVLLDEYQDTSIAQVQMLSALFGSDTGHPVTAVGDPNQAIYGWRGAAAGTLLDFPAAFTQGSEPAAVATLSTAWRNSRDILTVANKVAGPLRGDGLIGTDLVPELRPRNGAPAGSVHAAYLETIDDENNHIADFIGGLGWGPSKGMEPGEEKTPPSAAVLYRKRSFFPAIADTLTQAGIPYQITGLAGLLDTPEVGDLWAALRVAHDPTRGDVLMRLLTGPTMRIGAQDIWVLSQWSRELTRTRAIPELSNVDEESSPSGATPPEGNVAEDVEMASMIEALDQLPPVGWHPYGSKTTLTDTARRRLSLLAQQLRTMRTLRYLPLAELLTSAEHILGLDIDVLAHNTGSASHARRNLDEFNATAAAFTSGVNEANLGGFLAWLDAAYDKERGLDTREAEPDPNAVQIMTVHAAKGLEWDAVVVGGMNESDFPTIKANQDGRRLASGWLSGTASLPYELRGDAANLPVFDHEQAETHADMTHVWESFRAEEGQRELREDRRLAYVALTRAREHLLMVGSFWTDRTLANTPSIFLSEATRAGVDIGTLPHESESDDDPRRDSVVSANWPPQPEPNVWEESFSGVTHTGLQHPHEEGDPLLADWYGQARLLLAERDHDEEPALTTAEHLSASKVVAAARDPEEFALNLRRPIPSEPSRRARQGTRFHAWVERHFASPTLVDWEWLPGADDDTSTDEDLDVLTEAFLDSPWASREPAALEVDVETTVGEIRIRSRIDAVFTDPDGAYHVVDWKTGAPPRTVGDEQARAVQLLLYRLAWSRARSVPIERVRASFHYVGENLTSPAPDLSEGEIIAIVAEHLSNVRQMS